MTEEAAITPEQEEADFAAGFNNADAQAPAKPETKEAPSAEEKSERQRDEHGRFVAEEAKPEAKAQTQEAKAAAVPEKETGAPAKPAWSGVSEADWKALSARAAKVDALEGALRQVQGHYGEMKRSFTELQTKLAAGRISPVQLTAQALKRVHADFPDLAEAFAQDLNEALSQTKTEEKKSEEKAQPFDADAFFADKIAPAFVEFEARAKEREEMRHVRSTHRDFEAVVKSPEFATWLGTLAPEKANEYRESEDGFVAAEAVTLFKETQAKARKTQESKKARLEAAVTPQGDGGPSGPITKDDEALFAEGFSKAGRAYGAR